MPDAAEQNLPSLNVLTQYVKDLSFENPNAPQSLQPPSQPPQITISVNVNAQPLSDNEYVVELKIEGRAQSTHVLFSLDLTYGGVFRIQNVPQEQLHPVIMIECPRLLFPFAREVVASAVREGGFPPLLIDPIDFAGLYRQKLMELQDNPQA